MNCRRIAYSIALACAASMAALPACAGEVRAVIELFTSQGCSSCPPADKLAGELSRDPSLIVMSLPVDYWDYLGWKDTLALHGHSSRERAYAETRGDREVYTPQVVVNGAAHALGSDKAGIERAIAQTQRADSPLKLPVTLKVADGNVTVTVPDAVGPRTSGEVWLCPMTGKIPVAIGRGENRGKTLNYYNVVRRWVKLGNWSGKAETYSLPVSVLANSDFNVHDIDEIAVIVQDGDVAKPGVMLGAAAAKLQ